MKNWKLVAERWMVQWGHFVYRHRWWVLAVMILLVVAVASQMRHLYFDTSNEAFFHADDPVLINYLDFRDQFGREDVVMVAVETDEVFDTQFLRTLQQMQKDLEKEVPYIRDVTSLLTVRDTRGSEDELIVRDLIEDIPTDPAQLKALKEYVLSSPSYPNWIISEDGKLTNITLELVPFVLENPSEEDALTGFDDETTAIASIDREEALEEFKSLGPIQERELVETVKAITARYEGDNFKIILAGGPVFSSEMGKSMETSMPKLSGIALGTMVLLLLVLFRRISGVLLPVLIVLISLIFTLGTMGLSGRPFTVVNQLLPSFLLAVGVADAVHLLTLFYRRREKDYSKEDSIVYALGHSGLAIIMTSITTTGGMWSFANAEVAPIGDLGFFGGFGVLSAMLFTLTLLPALLAIIPSGPKTLFQRKPSEPGGPIDRVLSFFAEISIRYPSRVLIGSFLIVSFMAIGLTQLNVSHWPVRWFPDDHPFRVSTEVIDTRMGGSATLEVLFDTKTPGGIYEPDFMEKVSEVERIATTEMSFPNGIVVKNTQSVLDVLKESNKALNENRDEFYKVPDTRELIAQELFLFSNSGSDDLERLVDVGFSKARLSLSIPNTDTRDTLDYTYELDAHLQRIFGDSIHYGTAGIMKLWQATADNVISGMIESYSLALVLITVLMIVFLGSLRLGLLSMIPNLIPIVLTMSLMGWLGLSLDFFTVLTGSIGIGLVVDDTIHFFSVFSRYYRKSGDPATAVRATMQTTGRALLFTTLVLVCGFAAYTAAEFVNIFALGLLIAFCIGTALIMDILVAPALMMKVYRKKEVAKKRSVKAKPVRLAKAN